MSEKTAKKTEKKDDTLKIEFMGVKEASIVGFGRVARGETYKVSKSTYNSILKNTNLFKILNDKK